MGGLFIKLALLPGTAAAALALSIGASTHFVGSHYVGASRTQDRPSADRPVIEKPKITIYLLPNHASKELDSALKQLQQGEVAESLRRLQIFVTKFANRVIPVSFPAEGGIRIVNDSDTWVGVALFLTKHFEQLPPEIVDKVEQLDGPAARARLSAAMAARDINALLRIQREFPWTRAGGGALTAAADLLMEQGRVEEALAYYKRVLTLKSFRNDPATLARVAVLESALGGQFKIPRDAANEIVEAGGNRVSLKSLQAAQQPALPRGFLNESIGGSNYSGTSRALRDDPGNINSKSPWRQMLAEEPPAMVDPTRPVYPVVVDDTVYVSNGWSVAAFDMTSGTPRWNDPGFARFLEKTTNSERASIADSWNRNVVTAPAVANGIVVTPLFVPLRRGLQSSFQNVTQIAYPFPFRKLHAFDAKTGRELWSHWRPELAGSSSDFIDLYRCSAPPVIAENLVIAPVYSIPDDATIDFHLVAFDLNTGALVWDTNLVTGTGPINMFGRSGREFASSPPAVDRDRIYISSDLGTVACVDVATGQLVWQHSYSSIPIPRATSYYSDTPERRMYWSPMPPAVTAETVLFTPLDSQYLLAVERETGRGIARLAADRPAADTARNTGPVRYLAGAVDRLAYLTGENVVAVEIPTVESPTFRTRGVWMSDIASLGRRPDLLPRPVLTKTSILLPMPETEVVVLDRRELARIHSIPYTSDNALRSFPGHVGVGDGVVVIASNPFILGHSNLRTLVDSARNAVSADPTNRENQEKLGRALRLRAATHLKDREFTLAIQDLIEAERIINKFSGDTVLVTELNLALGEALEGSGDRPTAAIRYQRAFETARDQETRLSAGIAVERLLPVNAREKRLELLKALGANAGTLRGNMPEYGNIPYALYFCLRRADVALPRDAAGDFTKEPGSNPQIAVLAWQEAREAFPRQTIDKLNINVADFTRSRIADAIRAFGRECYAVIEVAARRRFEGLGADATPESVMEIVYTFPNSETAETAYCLSLERMLQSGMARDVVPSAIEYLTDQSPENLKKRIYELCGRAMKALGNEPMAERYLERAGAAATAAARPSLFTSIAGPAAVRRSMSMSRGYGVYKTVTPAANDGSLGDAALAFGDSTLWCFATHATTNGEELRWAQGLPRSVIENAAGYSNNFIQFPFVTIENGSVAIAQGDTVSVFRSDDGATRGSVAVPDDGGAIRFCTATPGAILLSTTRADGSDARIYCIDNVSGTILWWRRLGVGVGACTLVADNSEVMALSCSPERSKSILRFQLATGEPLPPLAAPPDLVELLTKGFDGANNTEKAQLDLYKSSGRRVDNITDSHVEFSHRFRLYKKRLVYYLGDVGRGGFVSLASDGTPAWKIQEQPGQTFATVLMAPESIYVLRMQRDERAGAPAELIQIDPASGAERVVARVPKNAHICGTDSRMRSVHTWTDSVVVTHTGEPAQASGDPVTRFDLVELETGRTWSRTVPVRLVRNTPAPAIGKDLIAIAYSFRSKLQTQDQNEMRIFRRESGEYAVERAYALHGAPVGLVTTATTLAVFAGTAGNDIRYLRILPQD